MLNVVYADVVMLNVVTPDIVQASKTDFKLRQNFYLLKPIEQNILGTYAGK